MLENELLKILTCETFTSVLKRDFIKVAELNAITALLMDMNIPFSLNYNQCTKSTLANAKVNISINATTNLIFTFYFK